MPPITTGLVLWLDADDAGTLTVIGGNVVAWADKASSATFYVPIENPTPTLNETYFPRPCVDFGVGESSVWLGTPAPITYDRPITIFQTLYWPSTSSTYAALSLQDGVASNALEGAAAPSSAFVFRSTQGSGGIQASAPPAYAYATSQSTVATGAWHTIVYQTPTAMSGAVIRYDGADVAIATSGTAGATGQFDTIGSSDGLYLANGAFAEILVYEGALSTAEIESVEAYLAAKWSSAGGGTDVDVSVGGVSAAAVVGSVEVSVGSDVSVSATGVAAAAAVGTAVGSVSIGAPVYGVSALAQLGAVRVRQSAYPAPPGVSAAARAGYVLIWSAVDDSQTPNWQNVLS